MLSNAEVKILVCLREMNDNSDYRLTNDVKVI